ncbi:MULTISPECIES: iron-sulfur cluster biosynthesis family protein [unclassified Listeria]|uniref:iron-sulfur cluster biosynthesis family protein n=1 Tax=unclassified Listeria TaxID=2642072 RepID=UPI000B595C62|nr:MULTISPECIES: iron-sulfur cluster biosynthesis family protein [unclassified Listeria]
MYLSISQMIQEKIAELRQANERLVLNLNDGAGKYSDYDASCALDLYFDLIVVAQNEDLKEYSSVLSSTLGSVYMKPYSLAYLDEQNSLTTASMGIFALVGETSGVICQNVKLKRG